MLREPERLRRIIEELGNQAGAGRSVFAMAAAHFGSAPDGEGTLPTGFDERAARLFEAIVESAFLVALSDGTFDAEEEAVFGHIVALASAGAVPQEVTRMLLTEFRSGLETEGQDARIVAIAKALRTDEQAEEVLRVAALLAFASEGLADSELEVLVKLAHACKLPDEAVTRAVARAREAIT